MPRSIAVLAAALAIAAASAEELPDHVLKLAAVKRNMKAALAALPDYACLATVERSQRKRPEDPFARLDLLSIEVAYLQGREYYSWPGGGRFQVASVGELVGTGMSSTGGFASHANDVFVGGAARISFRGLQPSSGRELLRWDFAMPEFLNDLTVQSGGHEAATSSQGSFWADAKTLDVVRLEVHAASLPPDFPIESVSTIIDFARMRVGSRNILLPQTATTTLLESGGREKRNITDFSHCRQYAADSVVNFAAPAPPLEPAIAKSGEPAEVSLPAGVRLMLSLKSPVGSGSGVIGTPLMAEITSDVAVGGKVVIPRGATVRGRLRQLDYDTEPAPHFTVGLEFNEIEFSGGRAVFFGELERIASIVPGLQWVLSSAREERRDTSNGTTTRISGWAERIREVPGVATFFVEGKSFRLPEGMGMIWRTAIPKR